MVLDKTIINQIKVIRQNLTSHQTQALSMAFELILRASKLNNSQKKIIINCYGGNL